MSNKPFNLNESVINSVRSVLVSSQEQEINSLVEQATSLFFAHNKDASKTLPVFVKEYVMKKTMNPTLATICETVAKDNEKNLTETVEGKGPQMLNEAAGSTPRTPKEKKLAAMAHPKDKITHKDVLVGRGVVAKEEAELVDEGKDKQINKQKKNQAVANIIKKKIHSSLLPSLEYGRRELKKEEVEQIDELKSSTLASYTVKASKSAMGTAAAGDSRTTKNRKFGIERAVSKLYKRAPDAPKDPWEDPKFYNAQFKNRQESTDTPGNSYKHQCAIHVKHDQFGEGKTIYSQHAEPDQDGNIAWYDVMFEHGIEKKVSINEIQVLQSESHMMHKKKKMKEEVEQVDEASTDVAWFNDPRFRSSMPKLKQPSADAHERAAQFHREELKVTSDYSDRKYHRERVDHHQRAAETMKEEVINELSKDTVGSYALKAHRKGDMAARMSKNANDDMGKIARKRYGYTQLAIKKLSGNAQVNATEEVEQVDEMMSDPETLRADRSAETRTTPSGRKIVVKKPKTELKVEDVEYVDEAKRGRPRKNPLPAGQAPEEGDKEHFIMQLRKSVSMRGKKDVEFDNGEKMKVPAHVASAVLDHYNSLKTAEQKDRLHKSVSKTPKHLMSHYEMYHGN